MATNSFEQSYGLIFLVTKVWSYVTWFDFDPRLCNGSFSKMVKMDEKEQTEKEDGVANFKRRVKLKHFKHFE